MERKIALVTGGSRGLGKDMALSLAAKGIDVILTFHSKKEEAEKLVREIESGGQMAAALRSMIKAESFLFHPALPGLLSPDIPFIAH